MTAEVNYPCREVSLLTSSDSPGWEQRNGGRCRHCDHPGCFPARRCHLCQLEWLVDAYAARVDVLMEQVYDLRRDAG